MNSVAAALTLGFWLGIGHAADADHVVAVSTIVTRTKRFGAAWLLGAFWGLGHMVTIFLVGAAIILLKVTIPARLGLAMDFIVGLALLALGILNLVGRDIGPSGLARRAVDLGWLDRRLRAAGLVEIARSTAVGLAHGLAGSASVALLVLATIPAPRTALAYLLVFGLGTMVGMLSLSALMEISMLYLARWWSDAEKFLRAATGLLSVACGLWVLYQSGLVDGLFLAEPRWTPR